MRVESEGLSEQEVCVATMPPHRTIGAMLAGEDVYINGDGSNSRDFCYIENAIQANILAATSLNNNTAKL